MSLVSLASFPNSRVKPRAATSVANTIVRDINALGEPTGTVLPDGGVVTVNGNTEVLGIDADRTYILLYNSGEADIVYSYTDDANLEVPNAQEGGFLLIAGASVDLETKSALYIKSTSAVRGKVSIDVGRG